jgi:hypothetical protein
VWRAGACLLLLVACGHRTPSPVESVADARATQARRVAADAGLPPAVQRFLAVAARGVAATFTVTYQGAGGARTTLAQRPPERRIDVVQGGATDAVLRVRSGQYACHRDAGHDWTCSRQPSSAIDPDLGVFSPEAINDTVATLSAARHRYRFEVVRRQVAGTAATCLLTPPTTDELCVAPSGALLRVTSARQSLRATSYRPSVDDRQFSVPA